MSRAQTRPCIFIPADDTQPVRVIEAQPCELEALQKLVGGDIELAWCPPKRIALFAEALGVRLQKTAQLFCNEDGRGLGLPYNERASALHGEPFGVIGDAFVMAVP